MLRGLKRLLDCQTLAEDLVQYYRLLGQAAMQTMARAWLEVRDNRKLGPAHATDIALTREKFGPKSP